MPSIYRQIEQMPYPLNKILQAARSLLKKGAGGACTRERIAAAFVLERMECLPCGYGVVQAWEHLDIEWQFYVRHLLQEYRPLIEVLEASAENGEGE